MLLLFVLLPTLLLILYPFRWFQKCLNFIPVRWYILHTFMDSFQGCYKDGTQPGTRDYRWFACMPFVSNLLMFTIGILTFDKVFQSFFTTTAVIFTIVMVNMEPFKESHYTYTYSMFTLLTAISYSSAPIFRSNESVLLLILTTTFPLLYISAITLHWMYRHRKFGSRLISRLHAWRHGYEAVE